MDERREILYEFGPFCLDTRERVLLRDGRPVQLKPKVYETLFILVSRSGHIVDKEELMRQVWPDVVVEENNLTGNIFALRRALAEHQYIETVPRRGYRFTAEVREVQVEDVRVAGLGVDNRVLIKQTVSTSGLPINSLAVLPFANTGADPGTEYLSDGITESIINSLSQLPGLRVSARNTVFRYKGRETDAQEVGRELKVGAVLTGRILLFSDRMIIRAELVGAADGWQLWGAQFDREPSDILALQEEIAREISERLRLKLTGRDRQLLAKRPTESTEAYHAYLKGRYQWNKRTEEGLKKGIEHFQEAIDIDPVYALAYTGLSDCYGLLGTFGLVEPMDAFPKMKIAANTALEIDDTLAEAQTSSAFVHQVYDHDWLRAEEGYARAIGINPNYATAYHWRATLFAVLGRTDESITDIERALELDPLSLPINTYLGWAYYFARDYDTAIKHYLRTLELDGNFFQVKWRLGLTFAQKGMHDEAIRTLKEGLTVSKDNMLILGSLGYAYAIAGKSAKAREVLSQLEELSKRRYVSPYHRSTVHVGLGEKTEALTCLERAYADHSGLLIYLKAEPLFDGLHSDRGFIDLLQRLGLNGSEKMKYDRC